MAKAKKLRGIIYSQYDTEAQFAHKLGWTRQRLNKITNGIREPNLNEVSEMAKCLGIPFEQTASFFLGAKSPIGPHSSTQ